MRTVYKYKLEVGVTTISLPYGAMVIDFNFQDKEAFLWAEIVTGQQENIERTFEIYGTGHPISDGYHYLKTTHVAGFVFHLYEQTIN